MGYYCMFFIGIHVLPKELSNNMGKFKIVHTVYIPIITLFFTANLCTILKYNVTNFI
jgi:hypothetical protein